MFLAYSSNNFHILSFETRNKETTHFKQLIYKWRDTNDTIFFQETLYLIIIYKNGLMPIILIVENWTSSISMRGQVVFSQGS